MRNENLELSELSMNMGDRATFWNLRDPKNGFEKKSRFLVLLMKSKCNFLYIFAENALTHFQARDGQFFLPSMKIHLPVSLLSHHVQSQQSYKAGYLHQKVNKKSNSWVQGECSDGGHVGEGSEEEAG